MTRRLAPLVRLAAVFACAAALGCAAKHTTAWEAPPLPFGAVSDDIVTALVGDGDRAWAARADSGQLDETIRSFQAAARYRPDDVSIMIKLARAKLARGRFKGDGAELEQATQWAERALAARNLTLRQAAGSGRAPHAALALAEAADLPALTVYAESLLAWARACGNATLVARRDWIAAAAERAQALDAGADFAAAARVLGELLSALPAPYQDLEAARRHFEAALQRYPGYQPARLAFAEGYAARAGDGALYRRLLAEVLAGDTGTPAGAAPENRAAQARARKLSGLR